MEQAKYVFNVAMLNDLMQHEPTSFRSLLVEALSMYEKAYSAQGGAARTRYKLSQILLEEAARLREQAEDVRAKIRGPLTADQDISASFDALVPYVDR